MDKTFRRCRKKSTGFDSSGSCKAEPTDSVNGRGGGATSLVQSTDSHAGGLELAPLCPSAPLDDVSNWRAGASQPSGANGAIFPLLASGSEPT